MANANYLVTQRDVKTTVIATTDAAVDIHRRGFSVIAQPYLTDSEAT
jgi:hypothetical protein